MQHDNLTNTIPVLDNTIPVLDAGFVKLVASMGSDMSIVKSARVSYQGLKDTDTLLEKDKKLIQSLIARGHTSPFECVTFTFAVKAPVFVFRQWHRHRTWAFNEVSARYKVVQDCFHVPDVEVIGKQLPDEKQMRSENDNNQFAQDIVEIIAASNQESYSLYKYLLEQDCPRELARTVLPLSMYSEMFATVNLHNLVHFLKLRCDQHAQYEIRVYADAMLELAKQVVPYSMEHFEKQIKGKML